MDFSYLMPTRVFFGKNCIRANGVHMGAHGKKALIVTGKQSARACGALGDVCHALEKQSVAWSLYEKVLPNPSIENVREAAAMAREEAVDHVIGIGGGSPLDAAKAVAVLAVNDLDDDILFSGPYDVAPLPVLAVPTTAGTGSEVTPYSILTDVRDKTKKNLSHPGLFPRAAFLDAAYLGGLPYHVTVHTGLDALSHAVESYLSVRSNEMSALVAIHSIKVLGPCLKSLVTDQNPEEPIREKLLYGSMLGGVAIAQTGTTMVHAMGYSLTFFNHMDHGKANAVLLCEALRFGYGENKNRIDHILDILGMKRIDDLQALFDSLIGRPEPCLDDELSLFTEKAMMSKSILNTRPQPTAGDIFDLYKRALG
ncbi:MAG: iron-containing alcohol dehydrogenase [Proteobacteria bacterium]|nr:iron-containing alcohol dehydrogenase [Pseudomonadota bacterium]